MSALEDLGSMTGEQFSIAPTSRDGITLNGTLTLRDPSSTVGPFLQKVHEAAMNDKLGEVRVDVTALTFMNSSAIRIFIDWVEWAKSATPTYKLHFVTNPKTTWQRSTFSAVQALGGSLVVVTGAA